MKRPHISPALVISLVALFVSLSSTAWAATGGNFILGQGNGATTQTGLTGNLAGRALQLTNTNTAAGATPLGLTAGAGRPPFVTNSGTKVPNLNADKLDGVDSTGFIKGVGSATAVAYPVNPGSQSPAFTFGPGWSVVYNCPANTANPGGLAILNGAVVNGSSVGTNLFTEPAVSSPVYVQMAPNSGTANLSATPSGQVW